VSFSEDLGFQAGYSARSSPSWKPEGQIWFQILKSFGRLKGFLKRLNGLMGQWSVL